MDIIFIGKLILNVILSLVILGVTFGVIFAVIYGFYRLRKKADGINNKYLRFLAKYGSIFAFFICVLIFIIFLISPAGNKSQPYKSTGEIKNIEKTTSENNYSEPDKNIENVSNDFTESTGNFANPDAYTIQKRAEAREQYRQEIIDGIDKKCDKIVNQLENYRDDLLDKSKEKTEKIISEWREKYPQNDILDNEISKLEKKRKEIDDDIKSSYDQKIKDAKKKCNDMADNVPN